MFKKLFLSIVGIALLGTGIALAAPSYTFTKSLVPEVDNAYNIGTSSPSNLRYNGFFNNLTVSGTCTGCGGSSGGGNSKWASSTPDLISIFPAGAAKVGIGTTTPNWSLQVASTTPYIGLTDSNAPLNKKHWLLSAIDGIFRIGSSNDALTSTTTVLSINGSNVGIGKSNPAFPLDTVGRIQASTCINAGPNLGGDVGVDGTSGHTSPTSLCIGYGMFSYSGIGLGFWSAASGASQGTGFWSNPSGVPTETMRFSGTANVGIGNTTPLSRLTVTAFAGRTTPIVEFQDSSNTPHFTLTYDGNVGIDDATPAGKFQVGDADPGTLNTLDGTVDYDYVNSTDDPGGGYPTGTYNFEYNAIGYYDASCGRIYNPSPAYLPVSSSGSNNFYNSIGWFDSTYTSPDAFPATGFLLVVADDFHGTTLAQDLGYALSFIDNDTGWTTPPDYSSTGCYAGTVTQPSFIVALTGKVGVATTTPYTTFAVEGESAADYFSAVSEIATSTFAGSVGIGTTTPFTRLSVVGNTYINGTLSAGTTTLTNLAVTNTSTSTFTGGLTIATNGFVYQQATGNVGIGTTSPFTKLSVSGHTAADFFTAVSPTATSTLNGPVKFGSTGTSPTIGNATLVGGTITVTTGAATSAGFVHLTRKTSGGTIGTAITYTITNGSFTITSDNILDTSTFTWLVTN